MLAKSYVIRQGEKRYEFPGWNGNHPFAFVIVNYLNGCNSVVYATEMNLTALSLSCPMVTEWRETNVASSSFFPPTYALVQLPTTPGPHSRLFHLPTAVIRP